MSVEVKDKIIDMIVQQQAPTHKAISRTKQKLLELLQRHDVSVDSPIALLELVIFLIIKCDPDFKKGLGKRRGPKLKWTPEMNARLKADVQAEKDKNPKLSEPVICNALIKREPYKSMVKSKTREIRKTNPGEALRHQYQEIIATPAIDRALAAYYKNCEQKPHE